MIVCSVDNSSFTSIKLYVIHKSWHTQPHKPHKSFSYFMYELLKELSLIDRYMKWEYWRCFEFKKWSDNESLYQAWKEHLKYTCYNAPCYDCWLKNIQHTSVNRGRVINNGATKTNFTPRAFTITKDGLKIYE